MSDPLTRIDPRQGTQSWNKPTDERHGFRLLRDVGFMLEAEDLQFHHDSAVFLPEYLTLDEPGHADQDHISGVAVIRSALLLAEAHPGRKLLIVGHTDRSGAPAYNLRLSQQRAASVLAVLSGDRGTWVEVAKKRSRTVDYQVCLHWISRTWGWPCDPVEVDDKHGPHTQQAVRRFQAAYNEFFGKQIDVDGIVGGQTWGALFDVFMRELASSLHGTEEDLERYRKHLVFVHDGNKAVGVGEFFPKNEMALDGYRSAKDRRVELLSYEPADVPQQDEYPTTESCDPAKTHIYNPRRYRYELLDVEPIPTLVWIDLQTIDELGYRVANVSLKLEPDQGKTIEITTDDIGYWSDRVLAGNKIRVTMADGRPVRFGATLSNQTASGGSEDTAVLVPRVAPRVVTDLIVPTVDEAVLKEHGKQVSRYGRHPKARHHSARSGGTDKKVGEQARKTSARVKGAGEDEVRYTRRTTGRLCADNLFIAGGFDDELGGLQSVLRDWLGDHHPSAVRRGYFLEIILPDRVLVFDDQSKRLGEFRFDEDSGIGGRVGAYAMLEFYGVANNFYFADMSSQTSGLVRASPDPPTQTREDNDPPESEKPTEASEKDPPDNNEKREDFRIADVLAPSDRDTYQALINEQVAARRVEIAYLFHGLGTRLLLARYGGTGLLENYPSDEGIQESVHSRNLKVAENIGIAYSAYIKWYIGEVEKIPTKQAPGQVHPEIRLHRMGPPDSTFAFPVPIGASRDQYRDILDAFRDGEYYSEFNAWEAITSKLNAIRGKRGEGTAWFEVEFSAEAGNFAGPLSGAKIKLNFEADSEGRVSLTADKEVPLTVGTIPKSLGGTSPVKMEFKKNEKTGRVDTKIALNVGKYGIEAESNGNVKLSCGPASQEWNQTSSIGRMGLEVSLRDLVAKSFKSDPPDWVEDLPDLKAKAAIGFRLATQGTLLRVVANSPGFFEMRPRVDFASLDWVSLDFDERGALETLGFDRKSWDARKRTSTTEKEFGRLTPDQKYAAILIPVPTTDPEWLQFWFAWEKRGP